MPNLYDEPLPNNIVGNVRNMTITTRPPTSTENGGTITINAQAATGAGKNGGAITLTSGQGNGTGSGGIVTITSGAGTVGGNFVFSAGTGVSSGGSFFVSAGDCFSGGAVGGSVTIRAGNSNAGTGGDFNFITGSGGATGGLGSFQSGNASTPSISFTDDGGSPMLGFFGIPPVLQQDASIASATFAAGAGTAVNDDSTFDGYTIGQIVTALKSIGLLA